MNPLATTTFSSGPSDTLAAQDVYAATGNTVINSIQDKKSSGLGFDFSSLLANGGKGAIGSAGSLLKMTPTGGVALNVKSITDRLTKAAPSIASSLRDMSSSAQANIAGTFKDSGVMNFKMGTDTFKLPSTSFSDVSAYGSFATDVNTFSTNLPSLTQDGMCSAYDIDSHASMISGAVTQGSNLGIPKSFSFMTSAPAVSGNSELLTKVASACIPVLAKNGDLSNLKQLTSGPGGQVINAVLPNYAGMLKQTYSYNNYGRNTGAPLNDYTNLVGVFLNSDSKWNVIDRIGDATGNTGTKTFNLLKVLGGSKEFQQLIAIGVKSLVEDHDDKVQGLAAMFGETTVDQQLKQDFPKLWQESYQNPQTTKKNKTIDPRVIKVLGTVGTVLSGTKQNNTGYGNGYPSNYPQYPQYPQPGYPQYPYSGTQPGGFFD